MDDTKFDEEMALNRQAYQRMREQIKRDYPGQYVAMAFGRVVCFSRDFESVKTHVDQLEPAPHHVVVFLAENEPIFEPVENRYIEFI